MKFSECICKILGSAVEHGFVENPGISGKASFAVYGHCGIQDDYRRCQRWLP